MVIYTRENGKLIKHTDMYIIIIKTPREPIYIWMELNTLVNGSMINKMARARKFGLMVLVTKESTIKAKSTEEDNFSGLMDQFMKENSS